jgi:predicted nucleic-acid-binding protein
VIALDTNVLVRLVTRDDEAQAQRARALFEQYAFDDGALFVSDVVLAELCWTLERSYKLDRADISRTVRALLHNATVRLESPAAVSQALAHFEAGGTGFPDCLIVAKANCAGCDHTATVDRRMSELPGVKLLSG